MLSTFVCKCLSNCQYTSCRSSDGRILVMSSTDGYCSLVSFAEGELGTPYIGKKKEVSNCEKQESVETASSKAAECVNREEAEMEVESVTPSNGKPEKNIKPSINAPDKSCKDEETKKAPSCTPDKPSKELENKENKTDSSRTPEESFTEQKNEESEKPSLNTPEKPSQNQQVESKKPPNTPEEPPKKQITVRRGGDRCV